MYTGISNTAMRDELRKLITVPSNPSLGVAKSGNQYTLTFGNAYGKYHTVNLNSSK